MSICNYIFNARLQRSRLERDCGTLNDIIEIANDGVYIWRMHALDARAERFHICHSHSNMCRIHHNDKCAVSVVVRYECVMNEQTNNDLLTSIIHPVLIIRVIVSYIYMQMAYAKQ